MKHFLMTRLLPVVFLYPLSAPGLGLTGGSLPDSQATQISRQVEEKAGQLVERAMDRRLEEKVNEQTAEVREQLDELPAALPIHTTRGQKAFNDVVLDDGFRTVESQWLVSGTEAEIASLNQPGITVLERRELSGLGMTVVRFRVSAELDSRQALKDALPDLADRLDRNHIYSPQSDAGTAVPAAETPQWSSLCAAPVRIGMVDTAIATEHPVFRHAKLVQQRFLALSEMEEELTEPKTHGTAVASLLVGNGGDRWPARLPAATVFNASVFYGRDRTLSGATLGHLLDGLNWLVDQQVSVINISLTGPDNRLLAAAVKSLEAQGIMLVAAVGNEGPASPPLYPAAYEDVIGVTAVNASGEPYRWAARGPHIMFAGTGVAVPVAHPDGGMAVESGTSLAAPVIAAALACQRADLPAEAAVEALIKNARDLGPPGRDDRFGHGFLNL